MGDLVLRIERLNSTHDRTSFECGQVRLDRYLREQASQDVRRNLTSVFVAVEGARIAGFFTLATSSIEVKLLPEGIGRKLPRYRLVPAVLMGRMAVSRKHQGKGIGSRMMGAALGIALDLPVAWAFFVVDAKDAPAAAFYRQFGFQSLRDDPCHMFLKRP
jgi:GNAT superfamily N-acetyltransferase